MRERLEDLSLTRTKVRRQHDLYASQQVADAAACRAWHALASQTEDLTVLRLRGNRQDQPLAVERRHRNLAAKNRDGQRHLQIRLQVVAAAFEVRVGSDGDDEVEITRGRATDPGLPLAGHAH